MIKPDGDEIANIGDRFSSNLRILEPLSRVKSKLVEKKFPESDFVALTVDCDNNPTGLMKNVNLVRNEPGSGFTWECKATCLLNVGDKREVRVGFVTREIGGKRKSIFGVLACRQKEGIKVK